MSAKMCAYVMMTDFWLIILKNPPWYKILKYTGDTHC